MLIVSWVWSALLTLVVIRLWLTSRSKPTFKSSANLLNSNELNKCFQHCSLIKFNPFADTGGEQSFILTLLDGHHNGLILTSLHGRGVTRFYAKRVQDGRSDQDLSAEEKQGISEALKN